MIMGIKRIDKIMNEEITSRAGGANMSEARLRWLCHMKRKTEEEVVLAMRTQKMEVGGHRKIGKPKLR